MADDEFEDRSRAELVEDLKEANTRASEAEQFLMYAPEEQIRLHRARVCCSQRVNRPLSPRPWVPMPRIEGGRSVWEPPVSLLDSSQVWELPLGSIVRWVGDLDRESGDRVRVATLKRVGSWHPAIGDGDFYWLIRRGYDGE